MTPVRTSSTKKVGWFADFLHGDPEGPVLAEQVGRAPEDWEQVESYLLAGEPLVSTNHQGVDTTGRFRRTLGPIVIYTDGEWLWPSDLPHYLREHKVGLPEDFLTAVREHQYIPPMLSDHTRMRMLEGLV